MALTLGGNSSSYTASLYMRRTKSLIDKTLERISSGSRLTSAADDPGGLAVSMKLQNELSLTNSVKSSVENAKSFLEVQDGALKTAGDLVSQMISLHDSYTTESNVSTKEVYASQFRDLQVQLAQIKGEKLNGSSLFNTDEAEATTIYTSSQGANGAKVSLGTMDYGAAFAVTTKSDAHDPSSTENLSSATQAGTVDHTNGVSLTVNTGDAVSISEFDRSELTGVLDEVASLRAQSGGKLSTLGFVSDYLDVKSVGLASANSRIMDADLAEESMNLTKYNIQYQAAAAALVQSNLSMEVVLELLRFPSTR
jgi:flagellin